MLLKKILNALVRKFGVEENGERVNIVYSGPGSVDFQKLNIYEKAHFRRYEYVRDFVTPEYQVGDMACGTGYGSAMLAEGARGVVGIDISSRAVAAAKSRYKRYVNLEFLEANLLDIDFTNFFDLIISFETVEHFSPDNVPKLFSTFVTALKPGGTLIFSTPYLQIRSEEAVRMGFHLTFDIDEKVIASWLETSGLVLEYFKYQSYTHPDMSDSLEQKDFIICFARKKI